MDKDTISAARGVASGGATPRSAGAVLWSILSLVAAATLVFGLEQVAQGAVARGESRRNAVTLQNEAVWRCNASPARFSRELCTGQAGAAPPDLAVTNERDGAELAIEVARGR